MFSYHRAIRCFALGLGLMSLPLAACDDGAPVEGPVDFASAGASATRHAACSQDYGTAARKGAGAEDINASTLWSVAPYMVLVPATGEGYVMLNVDAPHFDWLLYTTADVQIESLGGPEIELNGPVTECPELNLVEYGVHHADLASWSLKLVGAPLSRAHFYAGLAATGHSDLDNAGHAGHDLGGDAAVPDHGEH